MTSFHTATYRLLGTEPRTSSSAVLEVGLAERRLGIRLPAAVRDWYGTADGLAILARHSNDDRPIPVGEFAVTTWDTHRLLPFKVENQGVCGWAVLLDGSDDPPVYVDVDSSGARWDVHASTFSDHVRACVWDYACVLNQPAVVQAQNQPLTPDAVRQLRGQYSEGPRTYGWPGSTQHRFAGEGQAVLIWVGEHQADWFVGGRNALALESAVRAVWNLDGVGPLLYDCSDVGKAVLAKITGEA